MPVDRDELRDAVQAAIDARLDLDSTYRQIEKLLGGEVEGLDQYIDEIAGCTNASDDDTLDGILQLKVL